MKDSWLSQKKKKWCHLKISIVRLVIDDTLITFEIQIVINYIVKVKRLYIAVKRESF